jgi:hypothetical protein
MGQANPANKLGADVPLVGILVSGSVLSRQEIVDTVLRDHPSYDADVIEQAVDAAAIDKLERETLWPETTDCDRLDAAFEELNANGLIALHSPAATSELCEMAAISQWRRKGGAMTRRIGCVFYHSDDVRWAMTDGELHLGYTCFEGHPGLHNLGVLQEMVGHQIHDTLHRHGLDAVWSGSTEDKIVVKMTWLKRGEVVSAKRPPEIELTDDWARLCGRVAGQDFPEMAEHCH